MDGSECCDVRHPAPALEHRRGCDCRRAFFGGDPAWDINDSPQIRDGVVYEYSATQDTWLPYVEKQWA